VVAGAVVGGIYAFSHEAAPDCGTLGICITPH
jgi:hypothetical protein